MSAVAIRTDSGIGIGSGHVMRMLTLARELRSRGIAVCFVCRDREGDLGDNIVRAGFALKRLARQGRNADPGFDEDAIQTRAAIDTLESRPEWLVVDHYGIDAGWESQLRAVVGRVMVVDDLADRTHDCDVVLDQNLVADFASRYSGKVPAECSQLLGPRFALLQPIYAQLHARIPSRSGAVHRILVYFGGDDSSGLTRRALAATLRACDTDDIALDVVTAPNSGIDCHTRGGDPRITFHSHVESLAALIARADLALGAAGTTSWERLCLGLPAIVMTRAPNQRPIAAELQRLGLVSWLGDEHQVSDAHIERAVRDRIGSGLDRDVSERCRALIDGSGAVRVCDTILVRDMDELHARHAIPADEELLLGWANDLETRRNGFAVDRITSQAHHAWFDRRLRDVLGCHLYILETVHATPIGHVRFEKTDRGWEAHYALAPEFRRRGLGRRLLSTALRQLGRDAGPVRVFGRVKVSNQPSVKVFEALGFRGAAESAEIVTFHGHVDARLPSIAQEYVP